MLIGSLWISISPITPGKLTASGAPIEPPCAECGTPRPTRMVTRFQNLSGRPSSNAIASYSECGRQGRRTPDGTQYYADRRPSFFSDCGPHPCCAQELPNLRQLAGKLW